MIAIGLAVLGVPLWLVFGVLGGALWLRRRPSGLFQGLDSQVILLSMTHRVGPKGQVVIPKELREELGIHPGDEVSFWLDGDHVAVRPTSRRRPLKGRFAGSDLVAALASERADDRRREDDA